MNEPTYRCRVCRKAFAPARRIGLWVVLPVVDNHFAQKGHYICGPCNARQLGRRRTSDPDSPLAKRLGINRL